MSIDSNQIRAAREQTSSMQGGRIINNAVRNRFIIDAVTSIFTNVDIASFGRVMGLLLEN